MEIKVSKSDVIWSYAAQFFNLATGLITLPLILKMLSAEEVGLNYILISLASIIALFDMGFSGQFARFITYIFSGAQELQKDGMSTNKSDVVNQHLLATTILTAKKIYKYIAFIAFVSLVSIGTVYAWIKRYKENGIKGLETRPGQGRKPIMDCSDEEAVRKAIEEDRQSVLKAREAWEKASGKKASDITFKRFLGALVQDISE